MSNVMAKLLISVPQQLAARMRATIPDRKRSKTIAQLIEQEVVRREEALYRCATEVEKDQALHRELQDWEVTLQDGLDGTW
jgi:hypothetical protein